MLDLIAERNEIQKHGLFAASSNLSAAFQKNPRANYDSEYERQEEMIHKLNHLIEQAQDKVNRVEQALDQIKDDPFFDLIRLKYFEVKTDITIGRQFRISSASVKDQTHRIIDLIAGKVFEDEYLNCMLSWLV